MEIIKATSKEHLSTLIKEHIEKYGFECDLNHIDVSNITDLRYLFHFSDFNGDISQWDTSKVLWMEGMFKNSKFNGDISKWDVSNVRYMKEMFYMSEFNRDISRWDVSKVKELNGLFYLSKFQGDISQWNIYDGATLHYVFRKFFDAPLFYLQFLQDNTTAFPDDTFFVSEFKNLKKITDSLNLDHLDAAKYMHVYFSKKNVEFVNFNEFGL